MAKMTIKDLDINKPATEIEEAAFSSGSNEEGDIIISEDEVSTQSRKKKLQLSKEQISLLEESFKLSPIPTHNKKEELASKLKLTAWQVNVWFQNRRARTKREQMEDEYNYLKTSYSSLKEENQRLQLELEELHARRLFHQPTSTSSPAMCSRCQCIITHNEGKSDSGS